MPGRDFIGLDRRLKQPYSAQEQIATGAPALRICRKCSHCSYLTPKYGKQLYRRARQTGTSNYGFSTEGSAFGTGSVEAGGALGRAIGPAGRRRLSDGPEFGAVAAAIVLEPSIGADKEQRAGTAERAGELVRALGSVHGMWVIKPAAMRHDRFCGQFLTMESPMERAACPPLTNVWPGTEFGLLK